MNEDEYRRLTVDLTLAVQKVLLQVPNGLNGLPSTARSTKTSIVIFGPPPATVPRVNPPSRK